jgi:hypothetical protein
VFRFLLPRRGPAFHCAAKPGRMPACASFGEPSGFLASCESVCRPNPSSLPTINVVQSSQLVLGVGPKSKELPSVAWRLARHCHWTPWPISHFQISLQLKLLASVNSSRQKKDLERHGYSACISSDGCVIWLPSPPVCCWRQFMLRGNHVVPKTHFKVMLRAPDGG